MDILSAHQWGADKMTFQVIDLKTKAKAAIEAVVKQQT